VRTRCKSGTIESRALGAQAAAGGVAILTMVGSLGGFAGPALTGKLRDLTHDYTAGLLTIAGLSVIAAALCLFLKKQLPDIAPASNSKPKNSQLPNPPCAPS
jgi:cyanate permease